tara:strand:- start:694 stop:954 length:261 start_codon:yes stop_codon:yes gene_type:complete
MSFPEHLLQEIEATIKKLNGMATKADSVLDKANKVLDQADNVLNKTKPITEQASDVEKKAIFILYIITGLIFIGVLTYIISKIRKN